MPNLAPGRAATRPTLRSLELRCPPLPETLMDARVLIKHPDRLDVASAVDTVQRDPIVLARLLQTANSAYYGLRHTVSSGERAVGMLGPFAVAGIVLGMQMVDLPPVGDGPASKCFRRLVRHSLATAFLARHFLENNSGLPSPAESANRLSAGYTAGMLHDFGKMLLVYNFQEEAAKFYEKECPNGADERSLERERFGYDHTEVGEFAARKLCFPEDLVAVVRHNHDASTHIASSRLVHATAAADLAADALGFASATDHSPRGHSDETICIHLMEADLRRGKSETEFLDETFGLQSVLEDFVNRLVPKG